MRPLFTTVTVAALDRTLVTLDDLREQLRVNPNDTANNVWWTKVIARTSRQVEGYCNRVFVVQTYTDTFRAGTSGNGALILSQAPIDPATLVITIDGAVFDTASYALDPFAGLVYATTDCWTSTTSFAAEYTAGFDPIPDDVQQAVLDLCTMDNSGRGRDPMLRARESPGLGRQEYWVGGPPGGETIPQDIAGVLNPYVRGLVG